MYSEFFDEKDMVCPCCGEAPQYGFSDELVSFLDNLQYECAEDIAIESCYRCEDYNRHRNGYKNSYHQQGLAVNLYIPEGWKKRQFIKFCDSMGAKNIKQTDRKDVIHIDFAE